VVSERLERRLSAILAADVAEYSRLTGLDEEARTYSSKAICALSSIRRSLSTVDGSSRTLEMGCWLSSAAS
jgi:hypothetical protein